MDDASPVHTELEHWLHRLRNELNGIAMATTAAAALLDAGAPVDQVARNLARAKEGCHRCRELLHEPPIDR